MDILPLLLEIGFTTNEDPLFTTCYYLSRPFINAFSDMDEELFMYIKETNGVYNLILERTNFVPIRVEVKEENEKLVYDFISNHFGKEYVRDFKLKKIL